MTDAAPATTQPPRFARIRRLAVRTFQSLLALVGGYLLFVLVGLVPVNNAFEPAGEDGVEVFFFSNAVHSDIVVPVGAMGIDWRTVFPDEAFPLDASGATHLAIGWGDRGFYLRTRTWSDLKLSTAAYALFWPSETVLHVTPYHRSQIRHGTVGTRVTSEQYQALAEFIRQSTRRDDAGRAMVIADESYGYGDAFFVAIGSYHIFNTCNSWLGRAMQAAGIRTGWQTPLPGTPLWWLPKE